MRANRSDHRLYHGDSLDVRTKSDQSDRDAVSCSSFNMDEGSGLHYLNPTQRRASTKRRLNTVINDAAGLIINGSLFDRQLFQPADRSYVLDYSKTPKELNRFLEMHRAPAKAAYIDSHLFKLSFVITLSDWHVDKELLIDVCPRSGDEKTQVMEEINHYKRFCFPELNGKEEHGGTLVEELSTYVFTRTNSKGQVEYGYCRRIVYDESQITDFPLVICLGKRAPIRETFTA